MIKGQKLARRMYPEDYPCRLIQGNLFPVTCALKPYLDEKMIGIELDKIYHVFRLRDCKNTQDITSIDDQVLFFHKLKDRPLNQFNLKIKQRRLRY